ncbi:hypothetical protein RRG40_02080 [Mycoplasmopsis felis]|uniref:hypothetical protein n=1 Tax=Mycoplasmopsis felis TaxID=33923 RepID=UPI002AFFC854|nr:hypothetical protein [Mycoplasmopsis felis]WQQ05548.1 hypothetical protein RRG59_00270 [Mycoplasmopsis felis]
MKNINLNDLKEKVNKFLKDKKKVKLASIILGSSILGITTIAVVASVASKSNQMNESEHLFQVEPKPKKQTPEQPVEPVPSPTPTPDPQPGTNDNRESLLTLKISQARDYLQELNKQRYKELKNTLNQGIESALLTALEIAQNINNSSSEELTEKLNQAVNALDTILNKTQQDKEELDNSSLLFSISQNPNSVQYENRNDFRLITFELSSTLPLDDVNEISDTILVEYDNSDHNLQLHLKEFKENSNNQIILMSFRVFENTNYTVKGIYLSDTNQLRNLESAPVNVTEINLPNPLTPEVDNNKNTAIPNLEDLAILRNNLFNSRRLSEQVQENEIVNLPENKELYLYLINGEKINKYLPNTITYKEKQYSLVPNQTYTATNQNTTNESNNKIIQKNFTVNYQLVQSNENQTTDAINNNLNVTFKVHYINYAAAPGNNLTNTKLSVDRAKSNSYGETDLLDRLIDGNKDKADGSYWNNWNQKERDQSNQLSEFVFNVNNDENVLISQLNIYIKAANSLGGLVLPEEMKIQVSVDGVNFKDVERQDKINFADFGSHNGTALNSSEYTSLDNDSQGVKLVAIHFEPSFAKFIKFKWVPRSYASGNLRHYPVQFPELEFYDITNKDIEALKNEFISFTNQKTEILNNLRSKNEVFASFTDTNTKKYSIVISKAQELKNQIQNRESELLNLPNHRFKNEIELLEAKFKKVIDEFNKVKDQNPNNDPKQAQGLLKTRTLLNEIIEYGNINPSVYYSREYSLKYKGFIKQLETINNDTNATLNQFLNLEFKLRDEFEEFKKELQNSILNESVVVINEETLEIKNISTEEHEVSFNLDIYRIKPEENRSIKLNINNIPNGVIVNEIPFSEWSSVEDSQDNRLPRTVKLKLKVTGKPEILQSVSFDKILLGDDELIRIPRHEFKLQKLQNSVKKFNRTYDVNSKSYTFDFELNNGLSIDLNFNSKVAFKLENNIVKEFKLTKVQENDTVKYQFIAPSEQIIPQEGQEIQPNALYLKELRLNTNGKEIDNLDSLSLLKVQDNSDLTFNKENPLWHLKEVNLEIFDAYIDLFKDENESRIQRQAKHQAFIKIKNPENLITFPRNNFLIQLRGGNQLTFPNNSLVFNDENDVLEFSSNVELSFDNSDDELKLHILKIGYEHQGDNSFDIDIPITKFKHDSDINDGVKLRRAPKTTNHLLGRSEI